MGRPAHSPCRAGIFRDCQFAGIVCIIVGRRVPKEARKVPDKNDYGIERPQDSEVKISDEVIAAIASVAASQVQGVAAMSGNLVGDLGAILGRKNVARGVRVTTNEKDVVLDLYLNIKYGARIPEVAYKVQESVKRSVEGMTDLKVSQVNIHIQGVTFQEQGKSESDV
ncbi:MAG: Asp23/Gls24 family envelope stress response protein [Candidatus Fermentithermobacillus carboniphilus]|uniref:Asp23/Gls24 family envelope stress response protein n=1 Tax=Candidatus Fermentithermobacillus carboniphilus TaxID=3085328 RepID=A0AAT9LCN7_9FIRM|nr:MAG: Asp23/Gls24 family envelope stress response protein [Candidatus Fermentithermobacillus carboniphilus]